MENRKQELKDLIKKYDKAYEEGQPLITDTEYDQLYAELVELEKTEGVDEDSPTTYIEDAVINHLKKVNHGTPMLSQEKCHTAAEIRSFVQRTNDKKYVVDLKLDGISIALKYVKGNLVQAVTRGNGYYGYDITAAAIKMNGVPKKLLKDIDIEVRGEVIMNEDDFVTLNSNGEYSNSRNFVAGTLNALDTNLVKERRLYVCTYDIRAINGQMGQQMTTEDAHNLLLSLGFGVVKHWIFDVKDLDKMIKFCEDFNETQRPLIEYKIDGLVIKSNDEKIIESLGSTSKFPKSSIAFKFDSQDRTTKLLSVEWQVGRTGQITPVANFEEIEIDGVNINKASLANIDNIHKLDLKLNDTIVVARSNDVIPKVISVVKALRTNPVDITAPSVCPICGDIVEQRGPLTFCVNEACPCRITGKLSHFATRDAMNIQDLSDKTIMTIQDAQIPLDDFLDLYNLKNFQGRLVLIDGFGNKKVNNLLNEIEKSKDNYLHQLLFGLSIPNIGLSKAKVVANNFDNLHELIESYDNGVLENIIVNLPDFGEVVTKSIMDWLDDNISILRDFEKIGEFKTLKKQVISNGSLTGKTIVITGELSVPRKQMTEDIEASGGKVSGSVSAKTDYVLVPDNNTDTSSSKYQKAIALGITIIEETPFRELLK